MWRDFLPSIRRISAGGWAIISVLLGALVICIILAWRVWASIGATGAAGISGHGLLALVLGGFFTLLIGGGLMALLFYSARKGHDDLNDSDHRDGSGRG